MSERITAANLDEVIKRNEVIEEQMKQSASLIWSKYNTDMFLTEYIILAIHLNSQGALPDMVLNKVKENANLMV